MKSGAGARPGRVLKQYRRMGLRRRETQGGSAWACPEALSRPLKLIIRGPKEEELRVQVRCISGDEEDKGEEGARKW
jgi:hypothetical protein